MKGIGGIVVQVMALLCSAFFVFLSQLIIARSVPPDNFGQISSLFSITSILGIFAVLGLGQYILTQGEFSKEGEDHLVGSSYKVVFLVSVLLSVALLLFFLLNDLSFFYYPAFALFIFMQGINSLHFSLKQRWLKYNGVAINRVQLPLSRFVSAVFAIGLGGAGFILAFTAAMISLVSFSFRRDSYYLAKGVLFDGLRFALKSKAFALEAIISVFLLNICSILLGLGGNFDAAAYFNAGLSIILALFLFPQAVFVNYFFPKYVKRNEVDPAGLFYGVVKVSIFSLVIGIAFGIFVYYFGGRFILILFGDAYQKAAEVVQVLAWSLPFRFFSVSIGCYISTKDYIWKRVISGVLSVMVFFLVLNCLEGDILFEYSLAFVVSQMALGLLFLFFSCVKFLSFRGRSALKS